MKTDLEDFGTYIVIITVLAALTGTVTHCIKEHERVAQCEKDGGVYKRIHDETICVKEKSGE